MYDANKTLIDKRELLKIKLVALMAEAGYIRHCEAKQKAYGKAVALPQPFLYDMMRNHRVLVVRKQSRLTGLALAFIRGKDLADIEQYPINVLTETDWQAIRKMVMQYGSDGTLKHYSMQYDKYGHGVHYGVKPASTFVRVRKPHKDSKDAKVAQEVKAA